MPTISADSVLQELDELIRDINTHLPDVPGRNRLLRMCSRERSVMQKLAQSPTSTCKAVCSNIPHFKAIFRLANVYKHRLIGLLCRYRMPSASGSDFRWSQKFSETGSPGSSRSSASLDSDESSDSDGEDGELFAPQNKSQTGGVVTLQSRPSVVMVDLVCLQNDSRDRSGVDISCPGNAQDADFWAPLLWIKAVTRDADRLNSVWHGEALRTTTSCLSSQAQEMVSTASWCQRDQALGGGIKIVFHWMPATSQPDLTSLDGGLVAALGQLRVSLVMGPTPWSEKAGGTASPCQPGVSLKRLMLCNQQLGSILLQPVVGDFREHKFTVLAQLAQFFRTGRGQAKVDSRPEVENQVYRERTLLNVLLQGCFVYPYSSQVWESLDELRRVNLDTTTLISMVTEVAHFLPSCEPCTSPGCLSDGQVDGESEAGRADRQLFSRLTSGQRRTELLSMRPFTCAQLDWLRQAEAEQAALASIAKGLRDSVLMVCQTAVLSFIGILAYVAGPSEWRRGVHLVSRLAVLPDGAVEAQPWASAWNDRDGGEERPLVTRRRNNKAKTGHIFDFGNSFNAITMTSNSTYLRFLRQSGRRSMAIVIPARALTEESMRAEWRAGDTFQPGPVDDSDGTGV